MPKFRTRGFGSLDNALMATGKGVTPDVGMGATELCWTDRHAFTVVEVSDDKKRIVIQRDRVTVWKDHYGADFAADANGEKVTLTLRPDGGWRIPGQSRKGDGRSFLIGRREAYCDPSF